MEHSTVWKLCEEYFTWKLHELPEFATFCGQHDDDDKLNDHSVEAFKKRKIKVEEFLSRATELEATSELTDADATNLLLLKHCLKTYLDGLQDGDHHGYLFALSYIEGIHIDFEMVASWMRFESERDYQIYLQRLKELPNRIHSDLNVLRHAVSVGFTHSKYSMESVPKQLSDLVEMDPLETFYFAPFKSIKSSLDLAVIDPLKQQAVTEIKEHIQPALAELADFITKEYMKACRPREGIDSVSGGSEFYRKCLRWHTSLDITVQEVHDIGLAEVKRIRNEMERVIKKCGFTGDLVSFFHYLHNDPKFYFDNKADCLAGFEINRDRIRTTLPKLFSKIPESKLEIKAAAESRAGGTGAFYLCGTMDGSRPGVFIVNNHDLKSCPTFTMMTLGLHEGEPGHHFQMMYGIENKDVPRFRRFLEDSYYSHAPSKFPIHTAFCEGWGLYAETLGYELGLYEDPYSEFGHLTYEIFRACRLVVDTGLHAFGWTFEQAVQYFKENAALTDNEIRREVRRYITWPAQACAYKLGQLKIVELRKKAETALGDKFDIRSFHDEILRLGLVPLDVLEATVQKFINTRV